MDDFDPHAKEVPVADMAVGPLPGWPAVRVRFDPLAPNARTTDDSTPGEVFLLQPAQARLLMLKLAEALSEIGAEGP